MTEIAIEVYSESEHLLNNPLCKDNYVIISIIIFIDTEYFINYDKSKTLILDVNTHEVYIGDNENTTYKEFGILMEVVENYTIIYKKSIILFVKKVMFMI